MGCTLSQKGDDGMLYLIACRSRKLSSAEKNYPVDEKEMYVGVVETLLVGGGGAGADR